MKRGQEIQTGNMYVQCYIQLCMCNVTFSYVPVSIVTVEV